METMPWWRFKVEFGHATQDPFGRVRDVSKSSTDFEEDLGDVCLDLQNLQLNLILQDSMCHSMSENSTVPCSDGTFKHIAANTLYETPKYSV